MFDRCPTSIKVRPIVNCRYTVPAGTRSRCISRRTIVHALGRLSCKPVHNVTRFDAGSFIIQKYPSEEAGLGRESLRPTEIRASFKGTVAKSRGMSVGKEREHRDQTPAESRRECRLIYLMRRARLLCVQVIGWNEFSKSTRSDDSRQPRRTFRLATRASRTELIFLF